jgi:hypothetical protein
MKLLLRSIGVVVAIVVILFVMQVIASESGEVVKITTVDGSGGQHETHLWVVDHDGHAWLRSGSPTSGWYARLKETPTLDLERNGERAEYTITVDPTQTATINALMQRKYGWADSYVGLFIDHSKSVPIRLDRRPPET